MSRKNGINFKYVKIDLFIYLFIFLWKISITWLQKIRSNFLWCKINNLPEIKEKKSQYYRKNVWEHDIPIYEFTTFDALISQWTIKY